jgi:hypothetical protein
LEDDSVLDPSESMLIKRILNIASGFTSIKTFIDNNISVIGVDRALGGKLLTDINYISDMRFEFLWWYISNIYSLSHNAKVVCCEEGTCCLLLAFAVKKEEISSSRSQ